MKKVLMIMLALLMAVALLTACGDSEGEKSDGKSAGKDGEVVLLNDNENIFVIINDKKYNLYDKYTVQDLVDAGLEFEEERDLTKKEEKGYSMGKKLVFVKEVPYKDRAGTYKTTFFTAKADVPLGEEYWLKDCVISDFTFPDRSGSIDPPISIVGGLTGGCTKDDVLKVFGDPTTKNEVMLFYNNNPTRDPYFYFYFDSTTEIVNEIKVGTWLGD